MLAVLLLRQLHKFVLKMNQKINLWKHSDGKPVILHFIQMAVITGNQNFTQLKPKSPFTTTYFICLHSTKLGQRQAAISANKVSIYIRDNEINEVSQMRQVDLVEKKNNYFSNYIDEKYSFHQFYEKILSQCMYLVLTW